MTCLSGCVVLHTPNLFTTPSLHWVQVVLCKGRYVLCWSLLVFPSPEHCFGTRFLNLTDLKLTSKFQEASKLGWPILLSSCILHLPLDCICRLSKMRSWLQSLVQLNCGWRSPVRSPLRKRLTYFDLAHLGTSNSLRFLAIVDHWIITGPQIK